MRARKRQGKSKLGMVKGTCVVGGEKEVFINQRGMCEICVQKFEEIDRRASSRRGIRQDMRELDIPIGGDGGWDDEY